MSITAVMNPKGGVGKSTLASNIAGYFASQEYRTWLGDADRQGSVQYWLGMRPPGLPEIRLWDIDHHLGNRPPKKADRVVLDTPGDIHGRRVREVIRLADRILVPLQPSVFDMAATRSFLNHVHREYKKIRKVDVAVVGMRVDARTIAAEQLRGFVEELELPVLGFIRNTQNYVHLAAGGLTLFDVPRGRVAKDLEQWQPIIEWLEG